MISKEELYEWKTHPVTRAFFLACELRVEEAKEVLVEGSPDDSFYRGIIRAFREVPDVTIEGVEDNDD